MLPSVARSATPCASTLSPKNSTNCRPHPCLRKRSVIVSNQNRSRWRRVAGRPGAGTRAPVESAIDDGPAPEHRRFCLNSTQAPSHHPKPIHHRRIERSVPTSVWVGDQCPYDSVGEDHARGYSRLTWWTMTVSGGTTSKLLKARWPQRRKALRSRDCARNSQLGVERRTHPRGPKSSRPAPSDR
jgi:hypothetical protein